MRRRGDLTLTLGQHVMSLSLLFIRYQENACFKKLIYTTSEGVRHCSRVLPPPHSHHHPQHPDIHHCQRNNKQGGHRIIQSSKLFLIHNIFRRKKVRVSPVTSWLWIPHRLEPRQLTRARPRTGETVCSVQRPGTSPQWPLREYQNMTTILAVRNADFWIF